MGNCIFFFKIKNKSEKKYLSANNTKSEVLEPIKTTSSSKFKSNLIN